MLVFVKRMLYLKFSALRLIVVYYSSFLIIIIQSSLDYLDRILLGLSPDNGVLTLMNISKLCK